MRLWLVVRSKKPSAHFLRPFKPHIVHSQDELARWKRAYRFSIPVCRHPFGKHLFSGVNSTFHPESQLWIRRQVGKWQETTFLRADCISKVIKYRTLGASGHPITTPTFLYEYWTKLILLAENVMGVKEISNKYWL